jgi:excisionase family DNA binding protein
MNTKKRSRRTMRETPPALLTIPQAAERLRRKPPTVRRLIHAGKIKAVLVGQNVMVVEASVTEYLRPRPYVPQKPMPVCAGWNDTLRAKLARTQEPEKAPAPVVTPETQTGSGTVAGVEVSS